MQADDIWLCELPKPDVQTFSYSRRTDQPPMNRGQFVRFVLASCGSVLLRDEFCCSDERLYVRMVGLKGGRLGGPLLDKVREGLMRSAESKSDELRGVGQSRRFKKRPGA